MRKRGKTCRADSGGVQSGEPQVLYLTATGAAQALELNGDGCYVIGGSLPADIVVDDRHVSPRHAGLRFCGEQFILLDLDSSNGTFCNGVRISECVLHDGDVIRLGDTVMVFELEGQRRAVLRPPTVVAPLPNPAQAPSAAPAECADNSSSAIAAAGAVASASSAISPATIAPADRLRQRIEACKRIAAVSGEGRLKPIQLVPFAGQAGRALSKSAQAGTPSAPRARFVT